MTIVKLLIVVVAVRRQPVYQCEECLSREEVYMLPPQTFVILSMFVIFSEPFMEYGSTKLV